ncbi:MAG TPA: ankyrin repeat domain-containing protein, partial [Longimicrobiales bacterium]|nr:ankyrin repeat domain-containing protein [Longimicrobiales bacterium]
WHTPLVWAAVKNKPDAVRALLEHGAALGVAPDGRTLEQIARVAGHENIVALLKQYEHFDTTQAGRVRLFVNNACPDHHIRGPWHHVMARNTAERLLRQHPEIADDSFYTAIICGNRAEVERVLAVDPDAANRKGGPKNWEPLLYLCFTRLPHDSVGENAVAIAQLLLDRGADPNVYFMAGGSRYTPLVGAIGEGEEDRPPHQRRDELVELLLERGAEPYDIQVIYNIHFHGHVLWFLKLMHTYALRRGRAADWQDPEWSMLDMGGYGSGARWHLDLAVKHNDLELAEWALAHGANPDAPPARDPRFPKGTPCEEALRRGHAELADLLLRHGATRVEVEPNREAEFVAACLRLDRGQVKQLLKGHPEFLESTAALFAAAKQNRADVVAFLLDLGVSPDLENETRERTLHIAAYSDAVDVAALLIERGAEIDPVESNWENTPLAAAVHAASDRTIALLGRYSSDVWNLVFTGQVDRLRTLLAEQPDLARTVSQDGSTLLMWLPDDEQRARDIVELLLSYGADPAVRNQEGRTAADYAARRGMAVGL